MREQPSPFCLGRFAHHELQVLEKALLCYIGKPKFIGGEVPANPREPEIGEAKALLRAIAEGMKEIEEEWGAKCR